MAEVMPWSIKVYGGAIQELVKVQGIEQSKTMGQIGAEVLYPLSTNDKVEIGLEAELNYANCGDDKAYVTAAVIKYKLAENVKVGGGFNHTWAEYGEPNLSTAFGYQLQADVAIDNRIGLYAKYKGATFTEHNTDIDSQGISTGVSYTF